VVCAADANVGNARLHEVGGRAERLDVEVRGHGRKFRIESLYRINQPSGGQHHVDGERDLGLESALASRPTASRWSRSRWRHEVPVGLRLFLPKSWTDDLARRGVSSAITSVCM
jgi:hypothetical protein